jgi:alpha-beta hydrolase superfamily lysophospholipase
MDQFTMTSPDGAEVVVYRWLPSGTAGAPGAGTDARAVVQVVHGAAEHAQRYDRLARVLNEAGYAVYADDHRGHGRTARSVERAGLAGPDAWNAMVRDENQLTDLIAEAHPGKPIVLLGHSMGSFIAQDYVTRWGDRLAAAVFSGSSGSAPEGSEDLRERVEAAMATTGPDQPSEDFAMLFAGFNDPFLDSAPAGGPTGFEWLSRDADEVRKYVDDPFCGFLFSNGLVHDMAGGLDRLWEGTADADIPRSLPVLIISGARDPVGRDGEGVHELTERYRKVGLDVTEILYPDARHEIFNETNRDEVHRDLLAWLDRTLGTR